MRITYDRQANAAYLHLASQPLAASQVTTRAWPPPGLEAFIALDWHDGQLVGIEILDASTVLPSDLLDQAEIVS